MNIFNLDVIDSIAALTFFLVDLDLMFAEDGPVFTFLEPFITEPIGFDRFIDVTTRNGRKDQMWYFDGVTKTIKTKETVTETFAPLHFIANYF